MDDEDGFCGVDPIPIQSQGIWSKSNAKGFLYHDLVRLQIQLALMFTFSQSVHKLLKHCHFARLVSETLAGIVLGPTVLGLVLPSVEEILFPEEGCIFVEMLTKLGYMFFMFLMGVKMDPSMVLKVGIKAWAIATFSIVVPLGYATFVSQTLLPGKVRNKSKHPTTRFVIVTETISSFPVIACLLIDLKIVNSELGRIALASALIRDILNTTFVFLTNYLYWIASVANWLVAWLTLFFSLAFISTIVFGLYPLFLWIIRQTPEAKPVKSVYISLICFAVLGSAIASDNLGMMYPFGPFVLGLTVPAGPPLGSTLEKRLGTFTMGLLTPLLLTYIGMKINLTEMHSMRSIVAILLAYVIGFTIKVIAVFLPALLCKMSVKDAIALALIMSTQGIVELAGYVTFVQTETLSEETYALVALSVLLTAVVVPFLVRSVYDYSRTYIGYQKRNILHSTDNEELRIVACAHKQDDAMGIIKVLEASNPTKHSPIAVFALHLVELLGGTSPVLINHQLRQKTTSLSSSRSQTIIDIFNKYEQHNSGLVNLQAFTAISMPKFMHDDICLLAFDKLASLIILPFHKKWSSQGRVIFNNNVLKNINSKVMDMAPCSVGVLVDRGKVNRAATKSLSSMYRVAMIFLGGDDDREALAYAKRMANSPWVHLTIFRISQLENNTREANWESILDTETLKDARHKCSTNGNVVYREEKVKDGPETAFLLHSVGEDYDLIMVGRRHKSHTNLLSGLIEWAELPELGEIGDLLASSEIRRPVSVLVVQQQLMQKKSK
ncbi:cation/H(+) antiporter 4-like [Cornus florida]|uniref:cation/H(+) antiporter 4-like n=1 Tax=Cornus florida TaxID=4283 RepID=UPI00289FC243|nr:cation/H(+) antiporter 4-like [Cornus florida]